MGHWPGTGKCRCKISPRDIFKECSGGKVVTPEQGFPILYRSVSCKDRRGDGPAGISSSEVSTYRLGRDMMTKLLHAFFQVLRRSRSQASRTALRCKVVARLEASPDAHTVVDSELLMAKAVNRCRENGERSGMAG